MSQPSILSQFPFLLLAKLPITFSKGVILHANVCARLNMELGNSVVQQTAARPIYLLNEYANRALPSRAGITKGQI